jgi:hypothetical protein
MTTLHEHVLFGLHWPTLQIAEIFMDSWWGAEYLTGFFEKAALASSATPVDWQFSQDAAQELQRLGPIVSEDSPSAEAAILESMSVCIFGSGPARSVPEDAFVEGSFWNLNPLRLSDSIEIAALLRQAGVLDADGVPSPVLTLGTNALFEVPSPFGDYRVFINNRVREFFPKPVASIEVEGARALFSVNTSAAWRLRQKCHSLFALDGADSDHLVADDPDSFLEIRSTSAQMSQAVAQLSLRSRNLGQAPLAGYRAFLADPTYVPHGAK